MEKSGLLLSARNINLPPSDSQFFVNKVSSPRRRSLNRSVFSTKCSTSCVIDITVPPNIELPSLDSSIFCLPHYTHGVPQFFEVNEPKFSHAASELMQSLVLGDLDPATAKLVIGFLGPFLSAFGFLFILRIVMSWYPKLPVEKFPYIIVYAPTEPILSATRKLIPPLAGVDVTPVVWFGLISFLNEILVGPQGLLVLLSQQV